jgi:enhancer of polycomb-like protein
MTARATGQRFRQRKLSTKQNLPVVRENEVEQLADDDASRHIPKVETGVEKGEEIVSRASPLRALAVYQCLQVPTMYYALFEQCLALLTLPSL